jgi:hypothetical protein
LTGKNKRVMRRSRWLLLAALSLIGTSCGDDHSLPAKFHDDRLESPQGLTATLADEGVVLDWTINTSAQVAYYIVTLAEGTTGAEWKLTAPAPTQTHTVEFAWTDSFYTFRVEAVDATDFVSESSNLDTVFISE